MDEDIYDYEINEKENQKKLSENLINNESNKISKVKIYRNLLI